MPLCSLKERRSLYKGSQPSFSNSTMLWELDVNIMLNKGQMPWEAQISKVLSLKVSLNVVSRRVVPWAVGGGGVGFKYETKYQAFRLS